MCTVSGGGGASGEILYRVIPAGIRTGPRPHRLPYSPPVRERRRSPASPGTDPAGSPPLVAFLVRRISIRLAGAVGEGGGSAGAGLAGCAAMIGAGGPPRFVDDLGRRAFTGIAG